MSGVNGTHAHQAPVYQQATPAPSMNATLAALSNMIGASPALAQGQHAFQQIALSNQIPTVNSTCTQRSLQWPVNNMHTLSAQPGQLTSNAPMLAGALPPSIPGPVTGFQMGGLAQISPQALAAAGTSAATNPGTPRIETASFPAFTSLNPADSQSKDELSRKTHEILAACAAILPKSTEQASFPMLTVYQPAGSLPSHSATQPPPDPLRLPIADPSHLRQSALIPSAASAQSSSSSPKAAADAAGPAKGSSSDESDEEKASNAVDKASADALWLDDESDPKPNVTAIYPRRSAEDRTSGVETKGPVFLHRSTLSQLFGTSLPDAAAQLGISTTALKSACRKLGLKKWPYRRPEKGHKPFDSTSYAAQL